MAFSYANAASEAVSFGSAQGLHVQDGEELKEIQTGQLGFKTINAETKVKLLSTPWPENNLPIPSAQLLSVASSQGILVAAGPDKLVVVSTDGIRESLSNKEGGNVRDVTPMLEVPHERLTHVAFSSDESVLVVSGPNTAGLVAYEVNKIKSGNPEVALRINTKTSLRALVPNPNPQSAHLFAIIDQDGDLSVADLSKGQLNENSNGTTLVSKVACVSWSNRGKQLVAGLASGVAEQLKPDGTVVANIPKSSSIPEDVHMANISWLEDDTFFVIYTPNSTSADEGIPPSEYYIVERSNKTNFTFRKLPEILPPFGLERLPTHHYVSRLRKFEPHISDLLLLAATSATDIGIVSKSSQPLSSSDSVEDIVTNTFAVTTLEDDTRRAALPLSAESATDTSPIGMAIDLSSKVPVINPLPSDPEIQETVGPVPNLLVLNNEGLLCSWWVIYGDSVKNQTTFSGFESLKSLDDIRNTTSAPATNESKKEQIASTSAFNPTVSTTASAFTQPPPAASFGAPKLQTSTSSGFGTGNSFGTTSKIGDDKSSWTSTGFGSAPTTNASPAFGQPGFGKSAFGTNLASGNSNAPAFGTTPALGNNNAPAFGTPSFASKPAFGQTGSPAFGQTGFGSGNATGSFASAGNTTKESAFSSFANAGGFGAKLEKNDNQPSPFVKSSSGGTFGGFSQTSNPSSPFVKTGSSAFSPSSGQSAFGQGQGFGDSTKNSFGSGAPFKLGSTFKGDGTAKDDLPPPKNGSGSGFGLGSGFGDLLNQTRQGAQPQIPEAEMEDSEDEKVSEEEESFERFSPDQKTPSNDVPKSFITPPSTITQSKTTPAPPVSSLFGLPQSKEKTTPTPPVSTLFGPPSPKETTTPAPPGSSLFGPPQQKQSTPQQFTTGFSFTSTTPKETPAASNTFFGTKPMASTTPAVVEKSEPFKSFGVVENVEQTPPTFGKISESSKITTESASDDETVNIKSIPNPPLPPDPVSKPGYQMGDTSASSANSKESKEPDDAPLPPDFVPANKSATKEEDAEPEDEDADAEDDDGYSSGFEESSGEVTQEISATGEDEDEDATTEQLQTSPESSYKGGNQTSPTGGLFTKVSTDASKPVRQLFGEVLPAPKFPPPNKTQQSPRSPSPVRKFPTHDNLRSDNRSVSAPIRPRSAIDQRKTEYSQSALAAQAAKAREEEASREKARIMAMQFSNEQTKVDEFQTLEDDEDERIQRELDEPVQPSKLLDEFITYDAGAPLETSKATIPAQIERLYQDINSMIYTLGINARSLSSFMMYQKGQPQNSNWPDVLASEDVMDAMNEQWSLNDILRLHQGSTFLANRLEQVQVYGVSQKLEDCQILLSKDLSDLRTKITAIRRTLHSRANGSTATAALSAEQASVQHDLRKASLSVQTKLVQIEDTLAVMRARLAEMVRPDTKDVSVMQKKPTVEAVTITVAKMTSMAEKKSANVDVLEAQLKKLDISLSTSVNGPSTPRRSRIGNPVTPGSTTSSIFYTPDSKVQNSARSTRGLSAATVSTEDRERWKSKALRKKEVAATLKAVLEEKRKLS